MLSKTIWGPFARVEGAGVSLGFTQDRGHSSGALRHAALIVLLVSRRRDKLLKPQRSAMRTLGLMRTEHAGCKGLSPDAYGIYMLDCKCDHSSDVICAAALLAAEAAEK